MSSTTESSDWNRTPKIQLSQNVPDTQNAALSTSSNLPSQGVGEEGRPWLTVPKTEESFLSLNQLAPEDSQSTVNNNVSTVTNRFTDLTPHISLSATDASHIAQDTPQWEAAKSQVLSQMVTSQDLAHEVTLNKAQETKTTAPILKIITRGGIKTGGRRGRGGARRTKVKIENDENDNDPTLATSTRGGRGKSGNRGGRPRGSRAGATSARSGNRGGRPRGSRAGAATATSGRGVKRKRKNGKGDTDDEKDHTDASEIIPLPQLSSSGRRITQATTFSPVVIDLEAGPKASKRSSNAGLAADAPASGNGRKAKQKRLPGSTAVCKNCGRGHSPQSNMIVFCDGCNNAWHQFCHDRPITPSVILIEEKEWHCSECETQRVERGHITGKTRAPDAMGTVEKRQYFRSLEKNELVSLLLHADTLHPDLPVFGPYPPPPMTLVPALEAAAAGNIIMQLPEGEAEEIYEVYVEPEPLPYPKAGNGIKLPPENDDLEFLIDEDVATYSHSWFHAGGWAGSMRGAGGGGMGMNFGGGGVVIGVGA